LGLFFFLYFCELFVKGGGEPGLVSHHASFLDF
jgi:hypothetical protein